MDPERGAKKKTQRKRTGEVTTSESSGGESEAEKVSRSKPEKKGPLSEEERAKRPISPLVTDWSLPLPKDRPGQGAERSSENLASRIAMLRIFAEEAKRLEEQDCTVCTWWITPCNGQNVGRVSAEGGKDRRRSTSRERELTTEELAEMALLLGEEEDEPPSPVFEPLERMEVHPMEVEVSTTAPSPLVDETRVKNPEESAAPKATPEEELVRSLVATLSANPGLLAAVFAQLPPVNLGPSTSAMPPPAPVVRAEETAGPWERKTGRKTLVKPPPRRSETPLPKPEAEEQSFKAKGRGIKGAAKEVVPQGYTGQGTGAGTRRTYAEVLHGKKPESSGPKGSERKIPPAAALKPEAKEATSEAKGYTGQGTGAGTRRTYAEVLHGKKPESSGPKGSERKIPPAAALKPEAKEATSEAKGKLPSTGRRKGKRSGAQNPEGKDPEAEARSIHLQILQHGGEGPTEAVGAKILKRKACEDETMDTTSPLVDDETSRPEEKRRKLPQSLIPARLCWNCRKTGHKGRDCPEARRPHCRRCGIPCSEEFCASCTKKWEAMGPWVPEFGQNVPRDTLKLLRKQQKADAKARAKPRPPRRAPEAGRPFQRGPGYVAQGEHGKGPRFISLQPRKPAKPGKIARTERRARERAEKLAHAQPMEEDELPKAEGTESEDSA
ncbi:uncharacterized protein LOC107046357 [Diachasma alloeum]|uniref:uncharacterized protein LOC107046357 n=1 Tax=Diachasma alloeum TaxID=454923 RepID=UPI0007383596|nr:uncharacterized protein LOC107046357 [Diachasma alloeum]